MISTVELPSLVSPTVFLLLYATQLSVFNMKLPTKRESRDRNSGEDAQNDGIRNMSKIKI